MGFELSDLDPYGWGERDVNQFRTNVLTPSLQHGTNIRQAIGDQLKEIRYRKDPQAAYTKVAPVSQYGGGGQFRDRLGGLATRLEGIASGQTPGAGELAARRAGSQAVAQQQAMARMGRGANSAIAARSAASNAGDIGLATAGQAQQAALQDQQGALGQLGQVLGQGAAQDVQVGLSNMDAQNQRIFQQAGLNQATSLANMAARLQKMGLDDNATAGYLGQLFGMDAAEMQARLGAQQLEVQQELGLANVDTSGWGANLMNLGGAALTGYATGKSDRRAKTKIVRAKDVDSMLERLKPYEYDYRRPEKDGKGRHVSVMAQDLQKSKLGKKMVEKDGEGMRVVNYGKGLGTMLAAVVRVNERVKALEAGGK
jgi:endosialidase-like protein